MNNRTARGSQNGMTYLGMLILMIVIAFGAIIVIKVVPLYLEHFKVESSMKSLAQEPKDQLAGLPPSEIEKLLIKRLSINDVEHVTKDDISVTKEGGKTVISIDYEARVSLFMNIDLVVRFPDNRVELGGT
jgi:hypothetical protein